MADYEKVISDKLSCMFHEAEASGDLAGCYQRVNQLVLAEKDRSFKSGVRWAQHNRIGRFQVRNDSPVADPE